MKSAYERAMERFNVEPIEELSDEVKAQLAEVDSLYTSKIAQAELSANQRLQDASTSQEADQVRDDLVVELASLRERCEREKNKIRNAAT